MTQPIHQTSASGRRSAVRKTAFLLMTLVMTSTCRRSRSQRRATRRSTGSRCTTKSTASGEPVVLLHGAFMTITNNWDGWISELSKTRKVIAVEMQGHGRTADVPRDITYENLADDVAALLNASRDPASGPYRLQHGRSRWRCSVRSAILDKVRKAVIISSYVPE